MLSICLRLATFNSAFNLSGLIKQNNHDSSRTTNQTFTHPRPRSARPSPLLLCWTVAGQALSNVRAGKLQFATIFDRMRLSICNFARSNVRRTRCVLLKFGRRGRPIVIDILLRSGISRIGLRRALIHVSTSDHLSARSSFAMHMNVPDPKYAFKRRLSAVAVEMALDTSAMISSISRPESSSWRRSKLWILRAKTEVSATLFLASCER